MNRRWYFRILVSLFLVFFCADDNASWASYPEKPITLIVPFAPGGTTDMCIRPLSAAAKQIMGKPIALEYHAGGSGAVGMGILKNKKADGYTLGMTTQSCLIGQNMTKVPYDLLKDFNPIMQYADAAFGIVVLATSPWKTLKEFLDYAKANPKKIRHSSAGPGTPNALAMASLAKQFQIEWTHIPFEGAASALAALLGGHVEAYSTTMHCKPHITAGRLRILTALGEQRIPSFPAVPTLQELGIPITASNFNALIGPRGLPAEILETIHQAFK
jgi:tripartite-type tricarboxylate transporter receptor subunit TctC